MILEEKRMFRSMRSWELSGLVGRVGVMFRMCGIGLEYVSVGDVGMNGFGMMVFFLEGGASVG